MNGEVDIEAYRTSKKCAEDIKLLKEYINAIDQGAGYPALIKAFRADLVQIIQQLENDFKYIRS
jgi:hypothetical protein